MSTPSARMPAPRPPEKGSFPLDHLGECAEFATAYRACLQKNGNIPLKCRMIAKEYLDCRMSKGLMARESWDTLGLSEDVEYVPPKPEKTKEQTGFVAGLARARGNRQPRS